MLSEYQKERQSKICFGKEKEEEKKKVFKKIKAKKLSNSEKQKIRSLVKLPANKEMVQNKKALKAWFDYHMDNSKPVCENCGADLSHYSMEDWKASQHHIIEKSKINGCPSVASVLENHGVLGKFCCHGQWHTSQQNAAKMKCCPLFKERFKKFEHLIIQEEKRKIPKIFIED